VPFLAQCFEDLVPEMDAAMVEGNCDVHGRTVPASAV
jgi:hypothetical protein